MSEPSPDAALARAGRGFVWLTAAKLHFMLAGWAIYFVLPRLMSEVDWGRFLSVLFLVSILNNVMVAGALQGVSRFTAAAPQQAWPALRGGLGLFALLGALCSAALLGGAPWIAAAHADPSLAPLYRAAALIALGYALYAACVGSLNGRHRFGAQAGFDASYATLRLGLMITGALVAGRLAAARGAHLGYSAGALTICAVALLAVALPLRRQARRAGPVPEAASPSSEAASPSSEAASPRSEAASPSSEAASPSSEAAARRRIGWRPLLVFALPVALHQLGINVLMRTDALLVKALGGHLASGGAGAAGASAAAAADRASVLAGHYGTAQVFALVPYQALIALSMVVFPRVADAAAAGQREALGATARGALRFALLFGAGLAALLASQPANVIDLVYPEAYRAGGVALRWQAWGVIGLSLITLACAMLNAAGHTGRVLWLTFGTWGVQVAAVAVVLRGAADPTAALRHTALASAAVLLVGAGAAMLTVRRTFGASPSVATLGRVGAAAAGATAAGHLLAGRSVPAVLGVGLLVAALYLALLWVTGELGRADVAAARRILGRR
jgi:O-antigen/teichoic acid export membrane protein